MIETRDLILDKARPGDWECMLRNVWSHPESARYMLWELTTDEEAARARALRSVEFQKTHDAWFVYEKASGEAIGFAGLCVPEEGVCEDTGVCLGPRFVRKGYGRQILEALRIYAGQELGARRMILSAREENEASNGLIRACGFRLFASEERTDPRDGGTYRLLMYDKEL